MDFRGESHNSELQLVWYMSAIHFQNDLPLNFSLIYTLHLLSFQITRSKNASHFPLLICCFCPIKLHILSFSLSASVTLNDPKAGGIKYVLFLGTFMPGLQFLISELLLALHLCLVEELLICNHTIVHFPPAHKTWWDVLIKDRLWLQITERQYPGIQIEFTPLVIHTLGSWEAGLFLNSP